MESKSKIIKSYLVPFVCALVQWGLMQVPGFGGDFLSYNPASIYTWVQKGLSFCLLLTLWCYAFYIIRQARSGNEHANRGIQVFCVYFIILTVMLLLLWPGTWYWDDIGVLASAKDYDVLPWQHVLSSFFQNIFIQVIPTPGGVILMQLIIAGIMVSYVITDYEVSFLDHGGLTRFWIINTLIELIPFLLPPVVLYQYSGFRMGMYIFYEVFVLGTLMCVIKRPRELGYMTLLLLGLCTAVLSTWRSEGFLYAPIVMLLVAMQKKESLSLAKKIFTICVILVGVLAISNFQKAKAGNSDYSVVAILRPLCEVVRAADPVEDAEQLNDINKVVGTQVMLDYPDVDGENLLWKYDLEIYEYTDEEYSGFMRAFVGLCIRHPKAVIKERIKVFIDTSAIYGRTNPTNVVGAYYLFDHEEQNDNQADFVSWNVAFNRPISEGLRQRFILWLGCLRSDFSERITYRLVWDIILPILCVVALWIWLLVRKKWMMFIAMSAVALRLPILFLTAPATWTMYYLSFYLIGFVVLVWTVMLVFARKEARQKETGASGKV